MTDSGMNYYLQPRECWALVPPHAARAVLAVLYDALDRRPPFDSFELSAFDHAVSRVPPPSGLTPEQFRRAVFEELNGLPWSEGLEPTEGQSWVRATPIGSRADRVFFVGAENYRFKREAADCIAARMRADGLFGPDTSVDLKHSLSLLNARRGNLTILSIVLANYTAANMVQSRMTVGYFDAMPAVVRPSAVFLDPDIGFVTSDEEAERVIRQMWRYADALYRGVIQRVDALA